MTGRERKIRQEQKVEPPPGWRCGHCKNHWLCLNPGAASSGNVVRHPENTAKARLCRLVTGKADVGVSFEGWVLRQMNDVHFDGCGPSIETQLQSGWSGSSEL